MKNKLNKFILCTTIAIFTSISLLAQTDPPLPPEGIIYQAEARDNTGKLLTNKTLDVKLIITQESPTGLTSWEGEYTVNTDKYGLFSLIIGEGESQGYVFSDIQWNLYEHFLTVQLLIDGLWETTGSLQFLSVPYAMHAGTASSALSVDETDPVWTTDKQDFYTKNELQTAGSSQVNWSNLTYKPTTLNGYGITDGASTAYVNAQIALLQDQIDALTVGLTLCDGNFVDLQTDKYNCGDCGVICDPGYICLDGVCVLDCPAGQVDCNGGCVDVNSDPNNCGDCGIVCDPGFICFNGECIASGEYGDYCTNGAECNSGYCAEINGISVCSECLQNYHCLPDHECIYDPYVGYFVCELNCPDGFADCDGDPGNGCETDLQVDAANCGACDANCPGGFSCVAGQCIDETPDNDGDGWTVAAGDCDDNDRNNYPTNSELCDGQDNNCNGVVDEGCGTSLPESFDWRNINGQNWLTPIKNQGSCGSCFVFSPVAALEAKIKLHYGDPSLNIDLAEQEIVSCDPTAGCDGGNPINTLNYMRDYGIVEEALFPYTSGTTMEVPACIPFTGQLKYKIDGFETLNLDNPEEIKRALIEKGPIIYITSAWSDLINYDEGIYSPTEEPSNYLMTNTIVGYNDAESYWIIRSNWGTYWGENGYYRISYSGLSVVTPYKNVTYAINNVIID